MIRSGGIAEVVESNCDTYEPGQLLFGMTGWQDYVVADDGARVMPAIPPGVRPPQPSGCSGSPG